MVFGGMLFFLCDLFVFVVWCGVSVDVIVDQYLVMVEMVWFWYNIMGVGKQVVIICLC